MMAEDRAAIVVWQLYGRHMTIERFKRALTISIRPEWNRAVGFIADAIREAECEARTATRETVKAEYDLEADLDLDRRAEQEVIDAAAYKRAYELEQAAKEAAWEEADRRECERIPWSSLFPDTELKQSTECPTEFWQEADPDEFPYTPDWVEAHDGECILQPDTLALQEFEANELAEWSRQ